MSNGQIGGKTYSVGTHDVALQPLLPSEGIDYLLGVYVVGNSSGIMQEESGVFLQGQNPENLLLYRIDTEKLEGATFLNITGSEDLKSRLSGPWEMYEGEEIRTTHSTTNLPHRFLPIPSKLRSSLLDRIL